MDKHDLLKSIGFSDEYIDHLRNAEVSDEYLIENPVAEQVRNSFDVTDVFIEKSSNSFSTKIQSTDNTAPTSRSSRR